MKKWNFHGNRKYPKLTFLFQLWPPFFPLKMAEIEKKKKKLSKIAFDKYGKNKALSPLPIPGKIQLPFVLVWLFLKGNRVWSHFQGSESKFDLLYCSLAIPEELNIKSFVAMDQKCYFSKILSRIFRFVCFSGYHVQIFEKITYISWCRI